MLASADRVTAVLASDAESLDETIDAEVDEPAGVAADGDDAALDVDPDVGSTLEIEDTAETLMAHLADPDFGSLTALSASSAPT